MPRRAWSDGPPKNAACTTPWAKKRSRYPRIDDHAARVSFGHKPPHPLRLPAQTQLMAQPDRDLFRHRPPKVPARRQLHLGVRPRVPTPTVHHLLQHDHGTPLRLDLHRKAPPKETPPSVRPASSPG